MFAPSSLPYIGSGLFLLVFDFKAQVHVLPVVTTVTATILREPSLPVPQNTLRLQKRLRRVPYSCSRQSGFPRKRQAGVREGVATHNRGSSARESRESKKGEVFKQCVVREGLQFPRPSGRAERQVTHSSIQGSDECKRAVHQGASPSLVCRG